MRALDGKVAIVAGGGTGIGRATAELFAAEGARVVVFGRRERSLRDAADAIVKAGGQALAVAGDVAADADVERLVQRVTDAWGGVDALVNSAAIRHRGALAELATADFAEVLRVNLLGGFVLTRAVVPAMRRRGGGSIVHIGSAIGTVAVTDFSAYIASKAGLHMLARAAALELVDDGIRVNVVAPGTIDTSIAGGVPEFRQRMVATRIPMRRMGEVADVAHACLYLCSDASKYITGSILAVDGGWTAA